jgi:hypothetical protein
VAHCIGHDQLGGRHAGPNGAQPGAEGGPDALREGDGEVLTHLIHRIAEIR